MKTGNRKLTLGLAFLTLSTVLVALIILKQPQPDFIGLATVIGAQVGGVAAIVWGNAKEHETNGQNGKPV